MRSSAPTGSGAVVAVQVAHTGMLPRYVLRSARQLLDAVFDDLTDEDWEHALGGVHALVWEDDQLLAHGSLVQRRLLHGGRAWRTGYVEGVGVRRDRQRQGHGTAVLQAIEDVARRAYDLAALASTDAAIPFYARRGWSPWRGPSAALTPDGVQRTPDDDGAIHVLAAGVPLDLDGELVCDWRDGDLW